MRATDFTNLPTGTHLILTPYGHGGALTFATLTDPPGTPGPRNLTITAYLQAIRATTMTRLTWTPTRHQVRRHSIKATVVSTLTDVRAAEEAWMVRAGYHRHELLRARTDRTCLPLTP